MSIRAYCRIPKKKTVKEPEGSCPELLYDLFNELNGAKEIHIAAYLFNNPIYFQFLEDLSKKGCKIYITSLPLRGYKNRKYSIKGYDEKISGQEMAEVIYNKIQANSNMKLFIFPHLYSWYGALYANGGASYSFHVKAIYAKFENTNKCIVTSGNFMFSDPFHSENMLVIENLPDYEKPYIKFFKDIESSAIPYQDFQENYNEVAEFKYSFAGRIQDLPHNSFTNCFFTAPFYKYSGKGSNHYAGDKIIELISNAKKRVWLCAQHFHDITSFDKDRETIVKAIYNKFNENSGVEFKFLKQVPHSSLSDKRRAAITETLFQYVLNAEQRFNRLTHDKFIIIDDSLIVCTANFTSTQFAFGERIVELKADTKITKNDVFSEVNSFVILPNCPKDVLKEYENHFMTLWDNGELITIDL